MKNAPVRNHLGFWAFALIAVAGSAACGGDDHPHEGKASGAVCPSGSTLTYDSFGKNFMGKYCTGCHSATKMGDARQGAPADHNFDTFVEIIRFADHIDARAAAGPNSVNTEMPPAGDAALSPTEAERRQLGEWLACETADDDGGGTGDSGSGDGGGTQDTGRGDSSGTQDTGRGDTASDGRRGG
jgi:uncharacterized membrane protein